MDNYILTNEIVFDSKPDAVPYNYRISYKISQICLIISHSCYGRGGCSLVKMHIISSALNTKEYMKTLDEYVSNKSSFMLVRFDPAVNRAIKFAIADQLIFRLQNGTFRLTDRGKELICKINKEENLLLNEKEFLLKWGRKLTELKIEAVMSKWGDNYAKDK